jgi:hypothetical protein
LRLRPVCPDLPRGHQGQRWEDLVTTSASEATVPVRHTDRFFIGGEWVTPSSDSKIDEYSDVQL